jgi:hypothetical protein
MPTRSPSRTGLSHSISRRADAPRSGVPIRRRRTRPRMRADGLTQTGAGPWRSGSFFCASRRGKLSEVPPHQSGDDGNRHRDRRHDSGEHRDDVQNRAHPIVSMTAALGTAIGFDDTVFFARRIEPSHRSKLRDKSGAQCTCVNYRQRRKKIKPSCNVWGASGHDRPRDNGLVRPSRSLPSATSSRLAWPIRLRLRRLTQPLPRLTDQSCQPIIRPDTWCGIWSVPKDQEPRQEASRDHAGRCRRRQQANGS